MKEVEVLANIGESVGQPSHQPLRNYRLYSASLVVFCSTGITFPYLNAKESERGIMKNRLVRLVVVSVVCLGWLGYLHCNFYSPDGFLPCLNKDLLTISSPLYVSVSEAVRLRALVRGCPVPIIYSQSAGILSTAVSLLLSILS